MNRNAQLACAWSGPVMVVIWVVSFIALAGWIPLSIFCIWVGTTTWFLIRAIRRESEEEAVDTPAEALT